MQLNPYAMYLGDGDPAATIQTTPSRISELTAGLTEEQIEHRPTAGKWSIREIVAHLADCELVFAFRLRQTLAEDHPVLQPFDQEKWAARYANHSFAAAMRMFEASRAWNLLLIADLTPADRERQTTHPERGTMSLWTIVQTMAGHDINHLQQLERLAAPA
jgi:uncharacterized damage-inducible protein DinB